MPSAPSVVLLTSCSSPFGWLLVCWPRELSTGDGWLLFPVPSGWEVDDDSGCGGGGCWWWRWWWWWWFKGSKENFRQMNNKCNTKFWNFVWIIVVPVCSWSVPPVWDDFKWLWTLWLIIIWESRWKHYIFTVAKGTDLMEQWKENNGILRTIQYQWSRLVFLLKVSFITFRSINWALLILFYLLSSS